MLEVLLMQYRDIFGVDFPLIDFEGKSEIEVINTIYECVHNNLPYKEGMKVNTNIIDAPRSR